MCGGLRLWAKFSVKLHSWLARVAPGARRDRSRPSWIGLAWPLPCRRCVGIGDDGQDEGADFLALLLGSGCDDVAGDGLCGKQWPLVTAIPPSTCPPTTTRSVTRCSAPSRTATSPAGSRYQAKFPSSSSGDKGFQATSHKCPSGSLKYPEWPPQKTSCAALTMVPPARSASSSTVATSSRTRTL